MSLINTFEWQFAQSLPSGATIAGGSLGTLTDTTNNEFSAGDAGTLFLGIPGAGAAGALYQGKVSAFTSSSSVSISPSASTAVSNVGYAIGSNTCSTVTGVTSVGVALVNPLVAGDILIVHGNLDPTATVSSITDTAGNSFGTAVGSKTNADYFEPMFVCIATKGSAAGDVITMNYSSIGGSGFNMIQVAHFSGVMGFGAAFDKYQGTSGTSAAGACSAGAATPAKPNNITYAITGVDTHVTSGTQANWVVQTPNNRFGDIYKYIIQTAATAVNASATQSGATSIYLMAEVIISLNPLGDVNSYGSPG